MKGMVCRTINDLIYQPVIRKITEDDFNIDKYYKQECRKFKLKAEVFDKEFVKDKEYPVFKTMKNVFLYDWVLVVIFRMFMTASAVVTPYFHLRMYSILNDQNRSNQELLNVLSVIVGINVVKIVMLEIWWNNTSKFIEQVKFCYSYSLYKKSLRIDDCEASKEKLINICGDDLEKLSSFVWTTLSLPDSLIQTVSNFVYLFAILGFYSGLSIIVMLSVLLPMIYYGMKYSEKQEKAITENCDKRIKIITEVIRTIRFVKSYVWEDIYEKKINQLRQNESDARRRSETGWAYVEFGWVLSSFFVGSGSWMIFLWMGNAFTPSICFTVISLTTGISGSVFSVCDEINTFIKTRISSKRVSDYMKREEQTRNKNHHQKEEEEQEVKITSQQDSISSLEKKVEEQATTAKKYEKEIQELKDIVLNLNRIMIK